MRPSRPRGGGIGAREREDGAYVRLHCVATGDFFFSLRPRSDRRNV